MTRSRRAALAAVAILAHALAREVDRALGLVLRAEVEPAGLLAEVGRAMAADSAAAVRVAAWSVLGAAAWFVLARWRGLEPRLLWPLLLRPALTLLALVSVAIRPDYPYAFTLPVALTQDWGIAQDLLALATLLALVLPAPRFAPPRGVELLGLCFLAYAVVVPEWAWHWDSHPGNEPKTLRQAVALGHWLSFDAEPVTGPMEALDTAPLASSLARGAGVLASQSWQMLAAVAQGEAGREGIRATRIARQVVRGKDGGVYSVLSPGPSILLAGSLRADRARNRARGVTGRVAVSVLLFCALGALTVWAVFRLVRDATDSPGLAAALAGFFAFVPPLLFYEYQFYPELPGALLLALAFRKVALEPGAVRRGALGLGSLIALLPWLHQKFLPVWGVLLVTALVVGWRHPAARAKGGGWRWAVRLLAPNAVSLYLTALYNFAITGSVRPDALFLAWGPGGVTSARLGQGLLGLLFDSRFGILPYVPLLVLAAAGLATGGARRFATVLPAASVYYLTVASADNWSGAVCNLGRYVMPVVPLGIALVGIAIARAGHRRGVAALALALAAWTGVLALALRHDPHAANDCWLLLAKSTFADGRQYVPGLFIRTWSDAAPGLGLQLLAWAVLIAAAAVWVRQTGRGTGGSSPIRLLVGLSAALLATGFLLERSAGTTRSGPAWPGAIRPDADTAVFLQGEAVVREDEAVVGPGAVEVWVRTRAPRASIGVTIGGAGGFAHLAGRAPLLLRPSGAFVEWPLSGYHVVRGRDQSAAFSRGYLWLEQEAVLRPSSMELGRDESR